MTPKNNLFTFYLFYIVFDLLPFSWTQETWADRFLMGVFAVFFARFFVGFSAAQLHVNWKFETDREGSATNRRTSEPIEKSLIN